MKVKQVSRPGGYCGCCVFYRPSKHCGEINKGTTSCGYCGERSFKPWTEAADGTHSWNQRKKTLRKL